MKITASTVGLVASHNISKTDQVQQSLRAWVGESRPNFEAPLSAATVATAAASASVTSISAAAQAAIQKIVDAGKPAAAQAPMIDQDAALDNDPRYSFIRMMLEMMTGQKLQLVSMGDLAPPPAMNATAGAAPAPAQKAGYGIELDRTVQHDESEATTFRSQGTVRTEDGRQIRFDLSLNMQRQEHSESSTTLRAGDAVRKDPLVINFGDSAVTLGDQRFAFDLDSNGTKTQLPVFSSDSAYLAMDLNQNGKIDRGTELFGAQSGDGFADLATYDSDGNGWIDENDAAFAALKVWTPDIHGGDGQLATLAERGVGALSLQKTATPFELHSASPASVGAVRTSGTWLKEDGGAGSLQQIDLMV